MLVRFSPLPERWKAERSSIHFDEIMRLLAQAQLYFFIEISEKGKPVESPGRKAKGS